MGYTECRKFARNLSNISPICPGKGQANVKFEDFGYPLFHVPSNHLSTAGSNRLILTFSYVMSMAQGDDRKWPATLAIQTPQHVRDWPRLTTTDLATPFLR